MYYRDDGIIEEDKIYYNAENNPLYKEYWYNDRLSSKDQYEYNDYGYPTRLFVERTDGKIWVKAAAEYDTQGKCLHAAFSADRIIGDSNDEFVVGRKYSYEYYDERHYSSVSFDRPYYGNGGYKDEYKYGTDGKPGAIYHYSEGELSYYYIIYPNTLDNPGNANEPPADMRIWSYGGTLHVRTAQPAVLHVYTLAGALHVRLTCPEKTLQIILLCPEWTLHFRISPAIPLQSTVKVNIFSI
jgi:hypothetical protein